MKAYRNIRKCENMFIHTNRTFLLAYFLLLFYLTLIKWGGLNSLPFASTTQVNGKSEQWQQGGFKDETSSQSEHESFPLSDTNSAVKPRICGMTIKPSQTKITSRCYVYLKLYLNARAFISITVPSLSCFEHTLKHKSQRLNSRAHDDCAKFIRDVTS